MGFKETVFAYNAFAILHKKYWLSSQTQKLPPFLKKIFVSQRNPILCISLLPLVARKINSLKSDKYGNSNKEKKP